MSKVDDAPAGNPAEPVIVGQAVLRDYPLRLWLRQQQHMDGVIREFQLLLGGLETGLTSASPPAQLLELAEIFTQRFGALIDEITAQRQRAVDDGLDRMDSVVPMPEGTPELIGRVDAVLHAVDEYSAAGELLTLRRPPDLIAFSEWVNAEIIAQYNGEQPTPWPGPW